MVQIISSIAQHPVEIKLVKFSNVIAFSLNFYSRVEIQRVSRET